MAGDAEYATGDVVINIQHQVSFLNSIVRPDPNVDEDDSGDDEDDDGNDDEAEEDEAQ